jgi:hypothetical protein
VVKRASPERLVIGTAASGMPPVGALWSTRRCRISPFENVVEAGRHRSEPRVALLAPASTVRGEDPGFGLQGAAGIPLSKVRPGQLIVVGADRQHIPPGARR